MRCQAWCARRAGTCQIRYRTGPPDPDDEKDKHLDRGVSFDTTFDGAGVIHGDLTPECAAMVQAVLDALSAPAGDENLRIRPQRYHDALEEAIRPRPVPLDPASWQVLQRFLDHREDQRTGSPHVMVTKGTKAGRAPTLAAYASHVLDSCGVPPRAMRCTRLARMANTIDPKLVAAFGMNPEGVTFYLAEHVDDGRLPDKHERRQ